MPGNHDGEEHKSSNGPEGSTLAGSRLYHGAGPKNGRHSRVTLAVLCAYDLDSDNYLTRKTDRPCGDGTVMHAQFDEPLRSVVFAALAVDVER